MAVCLHVVTIDAGNLAIFPPFSIGFTTVISTDHIRHMLRAFVSKEASPVLWASTYVSCGCSSASSLCQRYHAGECASFPADMPYKEQVPCCHMVCWLICGCVLQIIQGWEAQNQLLYEKLDEMIGKCERRRESIIIEV